MLTIGILNSMPEAAVRSTERQFGELLTEAAGSDIPLRLKWFSLQPRDGYGSSHDLWATHHLDGLIATGTEPRAARLNEEPYWDAFTRTVEWATTHTTSAVWSCLGAHAAVLYLDGVQRRPFARKLHGVFTITKQGPHPLLDDTEAFWGVPHSRWNDLPLEALLSRGYRLLTCADGAGADLFVKRCGTSLFVFFQGHPEYDARALMREYRRDVLRFLTGDRPDYPGLPVNYFTLGTERQLLWLRERNLSGPRSRYQHGGFPILGRQGRLGSDLEASRRAAIPQLVQYFGHTTYQTTGTCRIVNPLFPSADTCRLVDDYLTRALADRALGSNQWQRRADVRPRHLCRANSPSSISQQPSQIGVTARLDDRATGNRAGAYQPPALLWIVQSHPHLPSAVRRSHRGGVQSATGDLHHLPCGRRDRGARHPVVGPTVRPHRMLPDISRPGARRPTIPRCCSP